MIEMERKQAMLQYVNMKSCDRGNEQEQRPTSTPLFLRGVVQRGSPPLEDYRGVLPGGVLRGKPPQSRLDSFDVGLPQLPEPDEVSTASRGGGTVRRVSSLRRRSRCQGVQIRRLSVVLETTKAIRRHID